MSNIIVSLESSNLEMSKDQLLKYSNIGTGITKNFSRKEFAMLSVIEYGITPIHVHGFMKEVLNHLR